MPDAWGVGQDVEGGRGVTARHVGEGSVELSVTSHAFLLSFEWSVLVHAPALPCHDAGPVRAPVRADVVSGRSFTWPMHRCCL